MGYYILNRMIELQTKQKPGRSMQSVSKDAERLEHCCPADGRVHWLTPLENLLPTCAKAQHIQTLSSVNSFPMQMPIGMHTYILPKMCNKMVIAILLKTNQTEKYLNLHLLFQYGKIKCAIIT